MGKARDLLDKVEDMELREMLEKQINPQINIRQEIRSLAGQLMGHSKDPKVREIAAALERCVERLEDGR